MTTATRPTIKLPQHLVHDWETVGGLSDPSKMPEFSWSTPAEECNVGGRLRLVPGSTCEVCYARKGRYPTGVVQRALYRRLDCWKLNQGPVFQRAMARLVSVLVDSHFRWFDAGDLANGAMLEDIVMIAKLTPHIQFWLPTRELAVVLDYLETTHEFPDNLAVRVSAPMVDQALPVPLRYPAFARVVRSSVFTDEHKPGAGTICRAYQNKGQCGSCRHCWDLDVDHVTYLKH